MPRDTLEHGWRHWRNLTRPYTSREDCIRYDIFVWKSEEGRLGTFLRGRKECDVEVDIALWSADTSARDEQGFLKGALTVQSQGGWSAIHAYRNPWES